MCHPPPLLNRHTICLLAYQSLNLAGLAALFTQQDTLILYDCILLSGQLDVGPIAMSEISGSTLLVVDVDQPNGPDGSLVAQLRQTYPTLPIAVVTLFTDPAFLQRLLSQRIQACLTKDLTPEQFWQALTLVVNGGFFFSLAATLAMQASSSLDPHADRLCTLTEREQQLFHLLCQGVSFRASAQQLNLSEQTVRNYASRLYHKLGVASKAELIALYRRYG